MEDNKSQNATPTLSVKSKEINDINISQNDNQKDISPLNTTNDIIPTVRINFYIISNLTILIIYSYEIQSSNKRNSQEKSASNKGSTTITNSTTTKFNEIKLMRKMNKDFDKKCLMIRNRIQRLKNEEQECLKKRINFKKKIKHDKIIREEKKILKNQYIKVKEEKNKEINSKKEIIQKQRLKDNIVRENKKNENLSQKKINYQSLLNEKHMMKEIREQLKNLQLNKNTYSHAKIKQELNEYETNKMKRNMIKEKLNKKMHENNIRQLKQLEEEMKNTCDQLEELERQAMERLKRTKYLNLRLFSADKTRDNFQRKRKFKIKSNKNLNKSMEDKKVNGINNNLNKTMEKEDVFINKSAIVNKKELMSPRKKDIKLKDLNKLYKGSSTSDFPKTNKEKNSHKINLKLKNSSFDKKNKKTNKNKYKTININKSSKSIDKK